MAEEIPGGHASLPEDGESQASVTTLSDPTDSAVLPLDIIDKFSDEATAAYRVAVDRYARDLINRARNNTEKEMVLKSEVDAAIQALRPTSAREATKIAADWTKRLGFLFTGFAVGEFSTIKDMQPIDIGGVYWLITWIVLATAFVVVGICLDRGLAGTVGRSLKRKMR